MRSSGSSGFALAVKVVGEALAHPFECGDLLEADHANPDLAEGVLPDPNNPGPRHALAPRRRKLSSPVRVLVVEDEPFWEAAGRCGSSSPIGKANGTFRTWMAQPSMV